MWGISSDVCAASRSAVGSVSFMGGSERAWEGGLVPYAVSVASAKLDETPVMPYKNKIRRTRALLTGLH